MITAILISAVFVALTPFILPTLNEFWGIEAEKQVVYVETDSKDNSESIFEKTKDDKAVIDEEIPEETTNDSSKIVIDIRQNDQTITKIAKVVSPSVVGIKVSYDFFSYFFGSQTTNSQGSGIIISSKGYILTNFHVIEEAFLQSSNNPKIEVFLMGEEEKAYVATVIGYESSKDLAVLKIEAKGLIPAQIGDSDTLQIGEMAIAIGNPGGLGLMGSVTSGIISGLNRQIPLSGVDDANLIQTDAAINPGNSGGALINSRGQVIGVNEAKISAEGYEGLGFAIPINEAMESYQRILENKTIEKNITLGISSDNRYTKNLADARGLPYGIYVSDVIPTSGAYNAGIKRGDIITKFNGVEISNIDEFNIEKNKHNVGDTVSIEIFRISGETGEYIIVDVELMSALDFQ